MFEGESVNLVDLVDTGNTGQSVSHFDTLERLWEYMVATGNVFPKESAYARGMLKFLLREILNNNVGGTSQRRRH